MHLGKITIIIAARRTETAIFLILKPPSPSSHLSSVVEIHKGLHLSSPQTTTGRSFNTSGLYQALWARAVAGACREQSPVSGRVSAGLSDGLVKLDSGCIQSGLGHAGVI